VDRALLFCARVPRGRGVAASWPWAAAISTSGTPPGASWVLVWCPSRAPPNLPPRGPRRTAGDEFLGSDVRWGPAIG